jgi:hypothetical protein
VVQQVNDCPPTISDGRTTRQAHARQRVDQRPGSSLHLPVPSCRFEYGFL